MIHILLHARSACRKTIHAGHHTLSQKRVDKTCPLLLRHFSGPDHLLIPMAVESVAHLASRSPCFSYRWSSTVATPTSTKRRTPPATPLTVAKEEGPTKDGKLHGRGKRIYSDGSTLEGEFDRGRIQRGSGVLVHPNGSRDIGKFTQSSLNGPGVRIYSDGRKLEGEFRFGNIYNGEGTVINDGFGRRTGADGSSLEGKFVRGRFVRGSGVLYHPASGDRDIGCFEDGRLVGSGLRIYSDGRRLEGTFQYGKIINGEGTVIHADGATETGTWVKGIFTGKRVHISGKVIEGTIVNSRAEGQAKVMYPDGSTLEGEFKNGLPYNASGTLVHADGTREEGEWKRGILTGRRIYQLGLIQEGVFEKGRLEGRGKIYGPDDSVVEGEFREGKIYHGSGILHHPDLTVDEGRWEEGNLIGRRTHLGGTVEEGHFENGRLHGLGKRIRPDGATQEGEFIHGKIYEGRGVDVLPSGDCREEGVWNEGILTGSRKFADKELIGRFSHNGRLQGHGEVRYIDGRSLVGYFRRGEVQNGQGVLVHPDNTVDEGVWTEGAFEGKRTYADGRSVRGKLEMGRVVYGQGVFVRSDGVVYEGSWDRRRFTGTCTSTQDGQTIVTEYRRGEIYNGTGTNILTNGNIEEGTFKDGRLSGKGRRRLLNGRVEQGEFIDGRIVEVQDE